MTAILFFFFPVSGWRWLPMLATGCCIISNRSSSSIRPSGTWCKMRSLKTSNDVNLRWNEIFFFFFLFYSSPLMIMSRLIRNPGDFDQSPTLCVVPKVKIRSGIIERIYSYTKPHVCVITASRASICLVSQSRRFSMTSITNPDIVLCHRFASRRRSRALCSSWTRISSIRWAWPIRHWGFYSTVS